MTCDLCPDVGRCEWERTCELQRETPNTEGLRYRDRQDPDYSYDDLAPEMKQAVLNDIARSRNPEQFDEELWDTTDEPLTPEEQIADAYVSPTGFLYE